MPSVTISIDEEVQKVIGKRAKRNFLTIREQIEEIIRQSAIRTKTGSGSSGFKTDDRLVGIFSRQKRNSKRRKKKSRRK